MAPWEGNSWNEEPALGQPCLLLGLGMGRVLTLMSWEGAACCRYPSASALLAEVELAAPQGRGQGGARGGLSLSVSLCSSFSLCLLRRWTQTCKVPSLTLCRLW